MKFYPILLSGLFFSSAFLSEVDAAEWVMEPRLALGSTYNDNITFSEETEVDVVFTSLNAAVKSRIKEQIWDVDIDARVLQLQYSDDVAADVYNLFFEFDGNYRTELHSWNLALDFDRNTSFDEDFDTSLSANTLLDDQTQRDSTSLSTGWTWSLNQAWMLRASMLVSEIVYEKVNLLDASDSESQSGQLLVRYVVDDLSNVSMSATIGHTERDQDRRESGFYEYDNTNVQLSYNYQTTENSLLNISLGIRNTETYGTDVDSCNQIILDLTGNCILLPVPVTTSSDSGETYSFSYDYKDELASYSLSLSRSITTSSNGFAQEFDDFTVQYNRNLSEKVSMAVTINSNSTALIDAGVNNSVDRDTIRIEPSVSWRLTKDSRLTAGYRYRRQAYKVSDADSNSIYINLSFYWPKLMSSY